MKLALIAAFSFLCLGAYAAPKTVVTLTNATTCQVNAEGQHSPATGVTLYSLNNVGGKPVEYATIPVNGSGKAPVFNNPETGQASVAVATSPQGQNATINDYHNMNYIVRFVDNNSCTTAAPCFVLNPNNPCAG